jgi:DNA-binding GntR family transcriptional regulator
MPVQNYSKGGSMPDREDKLSQKTVTQGLVREIRQRLLSGTIKGGEPLKQEKLATQFGVSRIPVREALQQLEAEGLVRFTPHKGAIATRLSIQEADELFHLRALLETDILQSAFDRLGETDFKAASEADARYDKAIEDETAIDLWGRLNWDFHRTLYEPAGRPRTLSIIANLHIGTYRYQRFYLSLTGGVLRAEAEHRLILEACRKRDRTAAVRALRMHILGIGEQITDALRRQAKGQTLDALTHV